MLSTPPEGFYQFPKSHASPFSNPPAHLLTRFYRSVRAVSLGLQDRFQQVFQNGFVPRQDVHSGRHTWDNRQLFALFSDQKVPIRPETHPEEQLFLLVFDRVRADLLQCGIQATIDTVIVGGDLNFRLLVGRDEAAVLRPDLCLDQQRCPR